VECQAPCGANAYCHLCPDRECTACDTYDSCNDASCGSNATNTSSVCECNARYVRPDTDTTDFVCQPCFVRCATCTTGALPNYSDCTACNTGTLDTAPDGAAYKFCIPVCPTGFATADGSCTIAEGELEILGYGFNAPVNVFANAGSAGEAYDIAVMRVGSAGHPAKNRGLFFNGSTNGHIPIPDLIMGHSFAFHHWVLLKEVKA
jgi:hypothetical protein